MMSQGLLWWSSVRLQAPNTGNMDSVPGWGRKIPHAPQQRERKKDLFPHLYPQKALYIHIYMCVCVCVYIHICPGDANGSPLQYSCLENSVDRAAWWASLWGCRESDTTKQLTHTHIYVLSCLIRELKT